MNEANTPETPNKYGERRWYQPGARDVTTGVVVGFIMLIITTFPSNWSNFNNLLGLRMLDVLKIHIIRDYSLYSYVEYFMLYIIFIIIIMIAYIYSPKLSSNSNKILTWIYFIVLSCIAIVYTGFIAVNSTANRDFLRLKETAICLNLDSESYLVLRKKILNSKTLREAEALIMDKSCKNTRFVD